MNVESDSTTILGARVNVIELEELIRQIIILAEQRKREVISNVNVHAINLAYELGWFRDFLNRSEIVFCDGYGVKWAAWFLHGVKLHRYTPPDWFGRMAEECAQNGFSMYFLGTRQEVVEKAAAKLIEKSPLLKIVGVQHGFFNKDKLSLENRDVITRINVVKPNILIVGFGMPTQEKWILENWDDLDVNVVIPVGAFFDYLAGATPRAPRWMTDHGLEWLGRLIIEPRRLWRRYLLGNPIFLWRVLLQRLGLIKC